MVTKSKKTGAKKGRVKVGRLKLNKETVKDLIGSEGKKIKGGVARTPGTADTCATACSNCLRAC
jgi:hypothetical protein